MRRAGSSRRARRPWRRRVCQRPLVGVHVLKGHRKSQLAIRYSRDVRDASPRTFLFWVNASARAAKQIATSAPHFQRARRRCCGKWAQRASPESTGSPKISQVKHFRASIAIYSPNDPPRRSRLRALECYIPSVNTIENSRRPPIPTRHTIHRMGTQPFAARPPFSIKTAPRRSKYRSSITTSIR